MFSFNGIVVTLAHKEGRGLAYCVFSIVSSRSKDSRRYRSRFFLFLLFHGCVIAHRTTSPHWPLRYQQTGTRTVVLGHLIDAELIQIHRGHGTRGTLGVAASFLAHNSTVESAKRNIEAARAAEGGEKHAQPISPLVHRRAISRFLGIFPSDARFVGCRPPP